jgi:hypothetical protein
MHNSVGLQHHQIDETVVNLADHRHGRVMSDADPLATDILGRVQPQLDAITAGQQRLAALLAEVNKCLAGLGGWVTEFDERLALIEHWMAEVRALAKDDVCHIAIDGEWDIMHHPRDGSPEPSNNS